MRSKTPLAFLGALGLLILGPTWWTETKTYVSLHDDGKALLFHGGWFFNRESHELHIYNGQWYLNTGEQLLVPIEGPYNDTCVLRLEDQGRAYRVNKTTMTRTELRLVKGEWCEHCDDGRWVSIFNASADD